MFDWLGDFFEWVGNAFVDAVVWVGNAFYDAGEWLVNAFGDAAEWLGNAFGTIVDWIAKNIPDWLEIDTDFEPSAGFSTDALVAKSAADDAQEVAFGEGQKTFEATDSKESFKFGENSTGDVYKGQADKIVGFEASEDKIHVPEGLEYSGSSTSAPDEGTYSVWQKGNSYMVTWKDAEGWNDIEVQGDDPLNSIVADVEVKNVVVAGLDIQVFNATEGEDMFVFTPETTGSLYSDQADKIIGFDSDEDVIVLQDGLVYGGQTVAPEEGEYSIWEYGENFVVSTKTEDGFHDIVVDADPTGQIASGLEAANYVDSEIDWTGMTFFNIFDDFMY